MFIDLLVLSMDVWTLISIAEHLMHYALGKKGHTHSKKVGKKGRFLSENKNVTYTQDFLDTYYRGVKSNDRY